MKKIYAVFCFMAITSAGFSQTGYSMYYQYSLASMPQLKNANGFGMDFFIPVKKSNFNMGISYAYNSHGYKNEPILFTATDGSIISTSVSVTNSFHQLGAYQRYNLGKFSNVLFPYVESRLGWNFFRTNLFIADPEDTDNCAPLEQEVLQRDNNWSAYAGAGVDIKIAKFCSLCNSNPNTGVFVNFSFGYMVGGTVNYMNVNGSDMMTGPHSGTHHQDSEGNVVKSPYYAPFINTQTQVVHEHHIGYVYTSAVRMMQIKMGISFKF
jgi:hypothetical protein